MTLRARSIRRAPMPRAQSLAIEDLTAQEMVMLKICEFTAGRSERCSCFYVQRRRPSCAYLGEIAAKIVADIRTWDGRMTRMDRP